MAYLAEIFSRGGFTDRYFTRTDRRSPDWTGRGMLGVRSEDDKQNTRALQKWTAGTAVNRKLGVTMEAVLRADTPAALTLRDGSGTCVTVEGDVPQAARKESAAMSKESVARSLTKLGNTPFEAKEILVTVDPGLMLPAASLNALRRAAAEALWAVKTEEQNKNVREIERLPYRPKTPQRGETREWRTARFVHPSQITEAARAFFDVIYLPLSVYDGSVSGVILPPVIFDSEREEVRLRLKQAVAKGARHLLLGNIGHLPLARESGLILHGDFRFNVTNSETAAQLQELGFADILLSPELTLPQIRDMDDGGIFAVGSP